MENPELNETVVRLVKFNGADWTRYSLRDLPKIPLTIPQTPQLTTENAYLENDRVEVSFAKKTVIRAHFYCGRLDNTLVEYAKELAERTTSYSSRYELSIRISPLEALGDNDGTHQARSEIKGYRDIRFVDDTCRIVTDDTIQVIEITNIMAEQLAK